MKIKQVAICSFAVAAAVIIALYLPMGDSCRRWIRTHIGAYGPKDLRDKERRIEALAGARMAYQKSGAYSEVERIVDSVEHPNDLAALAIWAYDFDEPYNPIYHQVYSSAVSRISCFSDPDFSVSIWILKFSIIPDASWGEAISEAEESHARMQH